MLHSKILILRWICTGIFFVLFGEILGCDSPLNHRSQFSEEGVSENKTTDKIFSVFPYRVEFQWLKGPIGNVKIKSQLLVFLKNEKGDLISLPEGLGLYFDSEMPSMGHYLPDPGYFTQISRGIYLNKDIVFNMPGDWKNTLKISDSELNSESAVKDQLVWEINF